MKWRMLGGRVYQCLNSDGATVAVLRGGDESGWSAVWYKPDGTWGGQIPLVGFGPYPKLPFRIETAIAQVDAFFEEAEFAAVMRTALAEMQPVVAVAETARRRGEWQ